MAARRHRGQVLDAMAAAADPESEAPMFGASSNYKRADVILVRLVLLLYLLIALVESVVCGVVLL